MCTFMLRDRDFLHLWVQYECIVASLSRRRTRSPPSNIQNLMYEYAIALRQIVLTLTYFNMS